MSACSNPTAHGRFFRTQNFVSVICSLRLMITVCGASPEINDRANFDKDQMCVKTLTERAAGEQRRGMAECGFSHMQKGGRGHPQAQRGPKFSQPIAATGRRLGTILWCSRADNKTYVPKTMTL
jgi:hypothetical protein